MKCPQCGKNIEDEHDFCPYCGLANRIYCNFSWQRKQEFWYKIFKWLPEIFSIIELLSIFIYAVICGISPILTRYGILDFFIIFVIGVVATSIAYFLLKIILSPIYLSIEYHRQIEENTRK